MAERLARFSGGSAGDPQTFGAGAAQAEVHYRAETVTYGYLAVVDGYLDPGTGVPWCTLTVTLPARVPRVIVDHRAALGRPGAPAEGWHHPGVGTPMFDENYLVTTDHGQSVEFITPALQDALLRQPVQRMALSGASLVLRTFDGARASADVTAWLEQLAAAVLAAAPVFATPMGTNRPFPPGLYGPNRESDLRASSHHRSRHGLFARLAGRSRTRV